MYLRRALLSAWFALTIASALLVGSPGRAASTVTQNFLLFGAGPTTSLSFSGQLQCEVQVNAPTGNFSAVPQYSTDGTTWVTASPINNGLVGAPGVYIGTNPVSPSYSFFRLNFMAFSGTQISGQIACGDSLPASGGSGGAVSSVSGGTCIQATPSTGAVAVSYTCASPTPFPTPSPVATSTAGAPSAIWTTAPGPIPQLSLEFPTGGAGGVTLFPTPAPTSTPYLTQNGYLATQGALFDCNGSLPHFLACPQAIVVGNGAGFAGVCSGYASWGTNLTNAVAGVIGEVAALGCDGPTTPQMTLDSHGDIGVGKGVYSDIYNVYNGSNRIINWLQASSDGAGACGITAASGGGLKYVASSGTCRWIFLNGPLANSALGLDASNDVISASTNTELSGEVVCAVSSATSCTTAAVTVRSGAHCLATMESTDSTVAGPYYAPALHNASGSLTVELTAFTAGTGNLAANYWCP